eukprot:scaffold575_cov186-Amphora_coffeaeformis.AAC.4
MKNTLADSENATLLWVENTATTAGSRPSRSVVRVRCCVHNLIRGYPLLTAFGVHLVKRVAKSVISYEAGNLMVQLLLRNRWNAVQLDTVSGSE